MKKIPFAVLVDIPIKSGFEAEYMRIANDVVDAMRSEKSFINATIHTSADDPSLFVLHETWYDKDDFFAVQLKRPYRQPYEARLAEIINGPRQVRLLDPLRSDHMIRDPFHP